MDNAKKIVIIGAGATQLSQLVANALITIGTKLANYNARFSVIVNDCSCDDYLWGVRNRLAESRLELKASNCLHLTNKVQQRRKALVANHTPKKPKGFGKGTKKRSKVFVKVTW